MADWTTGNVVEAEASRRTALFKRRVWRVGRLLGAAAIVAGVTLLMIRVLPALLTDSHGLKPAKRAPALAATRTALLLLASGVIALIGAYFTASTFRLNRRAHLTDRYTRAIDQLGNESENVRLGGIFALERLAEESADFAQTVVDVLSAFVRRQAPAPPEPGATDDPELAPPAGTVGTVHRPEVDRLL